MPFACIYVPNFPVAAALRTEPDLQPRALAILEGKPPLEKIFAVNNQAADMGIAPGMTKAQAELCADLALRPRSALQESSAHASLLDCAQSFSPCVEDAACDTALLDLAGMESLLGSLPEISRAIHHRAAALGLAVHVAVASNPDAAMLAARGLCGAGSCGASTLAHVVTIIPPGQEAERLGPLPVEVLFPDQLEGDEKKSAARLLETLDRWGIRNLRALAALPEVALSERLGQDGLRLQQLARGAVARTLVPVEEPMVFEEAVELEHPIVLLEPLAFLLNRLLEQICARLTARALSTQELRLTLELENFSARCESTNYQQFVRTLRLPLPMLDVKVFLKLLQLDLNAHPPGAPIMKIHLAAEPARPRSAQGGLFLPPSPEPEKLELTLARIAGMVGENKVGALELLDTHHPDGFRMQRFVAEPPRKNAPEKSLDVAAKESPEQSPEQSSQPSPVTALRRLRPPLRATVTLENGQPVRMACAKKKEVQGDVLWRAGPWRSSGDWWEREAWSRDEWDLALRNEDAVSFYRVVHDLLGGGWFVEGTYD
ncbi:MAG TPA: DNA polymerase Y family protein [Candidatus Binatus sp.]|nr:DNA polymerase Y family protein [Candidatus Binatus sp.]